MPLTLIRFRPQGSHCVHLTEVRHRWRLVTVSGVSRVTWAHEGYCQAPRVLEARRAVSDFDDC
jgi:hypothetical protein